MRLPRSGDPQQVIARVLFKTSPRSKGLGFCLRDIKAQRNINNESRSTGFSCIRLDLVIAKLLFGGNNTNAQMHPSGRILPLIIKKSANDIPRLAKSKHSCHILIV